MDLQQRIEQVKAKSPSFEYKEWMLPFFENADYHATEITDGFKYIPVTVAQHNELVPHAMVSLPENNFGKIWDNVQNSIDGGMKYMFMFSN